MTQAVEVHVGAGVDGHQFFVRDVFAGDVFLCPGHRQGPGGLGDRTGVVEDIFDGGADLIGTDQDHLVHRLAGDAEGLLAHLTHGHAVGEDADLIQHHPFTGLERFVQAGGVFRFHADDLGLRPQGLHIGGNAGNQPAAADGDEDGVDATAVLAQDLHCHRALAGDHVRVVVGRDVGHAALGHQFARMLAGIVVGIAVQHYLGAQALHRLHLDVRGGLGHHDQRL